MAELDQNEFNENCEIKITICIDVGDERIATDWEVTGTAADIDGVVNDASADLGRLERSSIPAAVEEQWQSALSEAEQENADD
jgi:hypothetical protein